MIKFILKFSYYTPTFLWRWNRRRVPKSRHIKFRRLGITQKKTCNKLYSHTQLSNSLDFRIYGCSRYWHLQFLSEAPLCVRLYQFIILYHIYLSKFMFPKRGNGRSQRPRGLRRRSAAARLLISWVRIPPGAWMFVCCGCCVLSGRGLCDELITRPEESYRLCCVVVCDLETSRIGAPYIYIYMTLEA